RAKSVKALELASENNKQILLVAQKSPNNDEPAASDLYEVGTIATVLQMLKLPDGTVKVLVEGVRRACISEFVETEECFAAKAEEIQDVIESDNESQALMRTVFTQFDQYVKLNKKIPPEILTSLATIDDGGRLADTITAHLTLKLEEKQKILEMFNVVER